MADEVLILVVFIAYGVAIWRFKITYQSSVLLGLICLGLTGVFLAGDLTKAANLLAMISYYFLAIGVITAIMEYRRDLRGEAVTAVSLTNISHHLRGLVERGLVSRFQEFIRVCRGRFRWR